MTAVRSYIIYCYYCNGCLLPYVYLFIAVFHSTILLFNDAGHAVSLKNDSRHPPPVSELGPGTTTGKAESLLGLLLQSWT